MGMSINNNAASTNAQVNLNSVSRSLGSTMERVSSGLRINSAKDDAAGMSIASKIGAQVSGMGQAARNVGSAMLLAKTAESDLGLMREGLVRMRTLAVQSADGSYSLAERTKMNNEFVELRKNIESIANTSNFNGKKLLDGSMTDQKFQVGANANETISMSVGSVSTAKLGSSAAAAISTAQGPVVGAAAGAGLAGLKEGAFALNGVLIGPSLAAADTASTVKAEASSIAKAAAVNAKSAESGVTATVNATQVAGTSMTAGVAAGTATINGVAITINTTADAASTRAAVIAAINAKEGLTGVTAVDSGTDKGGVSLVAKDGRNISLTLGTVTGANTGLAEVSAGVQAVYTGSITLNSDKAITVTSNQNGALGTGGIKDAGLEAGTFQSQTAYASTTAYAPAATGATAFTAGDFTINGTTIGASLASSDTKSYSYATSATTSIASKSASGIAKAAAINALTEQTGVTATVNATTVAGATSTMSATATTGSLLINGVSTAAITTGTVSTSANRQAVVDAINAISGQTGVTAVDSNDDTKGISLVAADGRNITAAQANSGTMTAASSGLGFTIAAASAVPTAGELDARTYTSTLTLSSASAFTVAKGSTTTGTDSLGLKSGEYGAGRNGGALSMANLLTAEGARAAMTSLDNSLNTVDALKADMGTMQNRFQSSADSLSNSIQNQTGVKDQIEQSDFIADTAKLTMEEFRAQVAGSTQAKANALQATMLQALIPR